MRKFTHKLLLKFTQLKTFIKNIEIEGISETTWR
jgi:hypothetical protein